MAPAVSKYDNNNSSLTDSLTLWTEKYTESKENGLLKNKNKMLKT